MRMVVLAGGVGGARFLPGVRAWAAGPSGRAARAGSSGRDAAGAGARGRDAAMVAAAVELAGS